MRWDAKSGTVGGAKCWRLLSRCRAACLTTVPPRSCYPLLTAHRPPSACCCCRTVTTISFPSRAAPRRTCRSKANENSGAPAARARRTLAIRAAVMALCKRSALTVFMPRAERARANARSVLTAPALSKHYRRTTHANLRCHLYHRAATSRAAFSAYLFLSYRPSHSYLFPHAARLSSFILRYGASTVARRRHFYIFGLASIYFFKHKTWLLA